METNVIVGLGLLVVWATVFVWDYINKYGLPS